MPSPASEISIDYAGSAYRGSFHTVGEMVHVASPYGSFSHEMGALQGAPETVARLVLWGLAQAWTRRGRGVTDVMSA